MQTVIEQLQNHLNNQSMFLNLSQHNLIEKNFNKVLNYVFIETRYDCTLFYVFIPHTLISQVDYFNHMFNINYSLIKMQFNNLTRIFIKITLIDNTAVKSSDQHFPIQKAPSQLRKETHSNKLVGKLKSMPNGLIPLYL